VKSKSPSKTGPAKGSYWAKRVGTRAFAASLRDAIEAELTHLATVPFGELIERKPIADLIDAWQPTPAERKQLAKLVLVGGDAVRDELRRHPASPRDLLGPQARIHIEALLLDTEGGAGEDFVADLMQQEFARQLFTEIVFTSIVSFNKKVNPLFGSFAMRAMEDQIKGFIRLFMPMIQTQAAAFARENRGALHELVTQMSNEALARPLREHLPPPTQARRAAAAALVQHALDNDDLGALAKQAAQAAWNSIHAAVRDEPLGKLLPLARHAAAIATQGTDLLLVLLRHTPILQWLEDEMNRSKGDDGVAPPRKPVSRRKARPA